MTAFLLHMTAFHFFGRGAEEVMEQRNTGKPRLVALAGFAVLGGILLARAHQRLPI